MVACAYVKLDSCVVCAVRLAYSGVGVGIKASWAGENAYFIGYICEAAVANGDAAPGEVIGVLVSWAVAGSYTIA